jgi:hypothetical protein
MRCQSPLFADKIKEKGILMLEGEKCGGTKGTWRVNMACDQQTFEDFLTALREIDYGIATA